MMRSILLLLLLALPAEAQEEYRYFVHVAPERADGTYVRPRWNVPDTSIWRSDGYPSHTPYSCTPISTVGVGDGLDREHIVSLREAWDSRPDWWTRQHLADFAESQMNLTLARARENRSKGARDMAEWQPEFNVGWLAHQTLRVKGAYGLTVDRAELAALSAALEAGPTSIICSP